MSQVDLIGLEVLLAGIGTAMALASSHFARRLLLPAPAILLLVASTASAISPGIASFFTVHAVQGAATVALILILFDGGLQLGLHRLRGVAAPVAALGIGSTFLTAGIMAVVVKEILGGSWIFALLMGTALAPTDPAVMFSVLGQHEILGSSDLILKGESGANDPVGISLMVAILASIHHRGTLAAAAASFGLQLGIGIAVGGVGGMILAWVMKRSMVTRQGIQPLRTLAAAAIVFGLASVAGGSGFVAVFVAGALLADCDLAYKPEVLTFHSILASLAEILVFTALGLTVPFTELGKHMIWAYGLVLAAILALVARPLATAGFLALTRLKAGERIFVAWAGLKGAVPILLAAFAFSAGVEGGKRLYEMVFVVVTASVLVQGASIPWVLQRLGIAVGDQDHPAGTG